MGVVDGLGGGDLLFLPDDLRCDAGGEHTGGLQVEGGFAYNGVMGKAEVLLIGFTDPENGAVGVREHHIVRQDQVVFGIDDVQQAFEVDVVIKDLGQGRGVGHGTPPKENLFISDYSIFKNE